MTLDSERTYEVLGCLLWLTSNLHSNCRVTAHAGVKYSAGRVGPGGGVGNEAQLAVGSLD